MKTALLLSTAFITTMPEAPRREQRLRQYMNGLRQVAEMTARFPDFDVYSVDNTVEDERRLDPRLIAALDRIPRLKGKRYFLDNETGRLFKGSGLVIQWAKLLPELIDSYPFVVHYEPRQDLVNWSFFEKMAREPAAYACFYRDRMRFYGISVTQSCLWTGLFSLPVAALLGYVKWEDRSVVSSMAQYRKWKLLRGLRRRLLPWYAERKEVIEIDLTNYIRRHKIPVTALPSLGCRWHDDAHGTWVHMVDTTYLHLWGRREPGSEPATC